MERLIAATPEEVFHAYTDPEAQKIWFQLLGEPMIVENDSHRRHLSGSNCMRRALVVTGLTTPVPPEVHIVCRYRSSL